MKSGAKSSVHGNIWGNSSCCHLGILYILIALLVILDAYATMGPMSLTIVVIVAGGGVYNLMLINKKDVFELSDINFLKWNSIILLIIAVIYLMSIR
ncbi:hypothetical protein [Acetobacterium bakii]|uniref:Uncharacterized protein n=1 Tax=Acetobacterium bakii TaxID=52689 RepID=A0A0L6TYR8_9FIRM|nr:hypothetical protein [Acetobacterium bakii]KNZ40720.1 hypothetical protein AKG39_16165 [Acetobacterium bakii]